MKHRSMPSRADPLLGDAGRGKTVLSKTDAGSAISQRWYWLLLALFCALKTDSIHAFAWNMRVRLPFASRTWLSSIRHDHWPIKQERIPPRSTRLYSSRQQQQTDDPFLILGLDEPTADMKAIKRAYKRMALKYHPDVATTKDSTPQEKKAASDRFAKINWAYQTLSGKNQGSGSSTSGASSSSSSTTGTTGGWTPPHRRTESYYTGSSSAPPSWEDFMPKYDESEYDAGGDSFGAIFSDLITGAVSGVGGGAGIFKDFVEFLEGNIDGYTGGSADDAELLMLLRTGSLSEVAEEMDDTQLVVDQLSKKLNKIKDDIIMLTAELGASTRFSEKIDIEEKLDELKARKNIVTGYVKKSQGRLLKLQSRYKELISRGQNDSYAGGRSQSESSKYAGTYSSNPSGSYSSSSTASSTSSSRPPSASSSNEPWRRESFGSSGRSRGSSRRRSQASPRQPEPSVNRNEPQRSRVSESSSTPASNVPPHRRPSFQTEMDDKKRMREIKVDEEFDRLKKELGL